MTRIDRFHARRHIGKNEGARQFDRYFRRRRVGRIDDRRSRGHGRDVRHVERAARGIRVWRYVGRRPLAQVAKQGLRLIPQRSHRPGVRQRCQFSLTRGQALGFARRFLLRQHFGCRCRRQHVGAGPGIPARQFNG
ncbi:MAG: hypothetical protein J0I27_02205 [Pandoraea pnomenusa]|nr:hypothetical protein [Pandoraea pnomenusa]